MIYTITLNYQGKDYSYTQDFTSNGRVKSEGWSDDDLVHWMYTEGNYDCDCNRSDFLYQFCDVDFKDDPNAELDDHYEEPAWTLKCGRTIQLVSIREGERVIWPEPLPRAKIVFMEQRASGVYVPREI